MAEFGAHRFRHKHRFNELGNDRARADQHQVVERPGIGDDEPHADLEAESSQVLPLALQIVEAVGLEHVMRLEKSVERVAGFEA